PAYVSTVDSGNLLGCLLALNQGLREKAEEVWPSPAWMAGLSDTLALAVEALKVLLSRSLTGGDEVLRSLQRDAHELHALLDESPRDLRQWRDWLARLEQRALVMRDRIQPLSLELREVPEDLERWTRRLHEQARGRRSELAAFAPWLDLLPADAAKSDLPAEVRGPWQELCRRLTTPTSLAKFLEQQEEVLNTLAALAERWPADDRARPRMDDLAAAVRSSAADELRDRCRELAAQSTALAEEMDFRLLYNEHRHLFAVGYSLAAGRLDNAHYDLLASEARLASFLAI